MTAPLLELRNLSRHYGGGLTGKAGGQRALDAVSLTVERASIFGIVGESGCGKSTLARLVAALDTPTQGEVLLEGEDLFALNARALARRRRDFQMVFQDPYGSLDPRQRVGRIVAEPLHVLDPRPSKAAREARVAEVLESVGLRAGDAARFPHEFSGGQRQRIAIARALVTGPKLVVADEAVSALDLSVQAQVLNLVLDLRERDGVAFLFITHNLGVVDAICDRVGVMYLGRLVETGPAAEAFERPLHPYTRLLLEAEPRLDAAQMPPPRRPAPFAGDPATWQGCAFRPRCPLATERCRAETPLPRDLPSLPGRFVACHHAEAMAAEPHRLPPAKAQKP
ncbi:oligopeptide/dipeptide ABC transporter ATP-binding protein [Aurantimonas sp. Leaf443]|uniref:oligopeptide/dipeptide ABC transporter ATP-binding protein n=1 Tax=Aurantimonas sp. Leaf443 TaxID=1736378 RepID=UPI0006F615B2|nr:oligopeptide/dipeptide ABC transporter ATP-binding protein [Aurantimonas sp. Leaf443]KQT85751.1 peptide ABC transporter ATP-binding protein [Aurantimonas sp. Leaf443]